MGPRKGGGGSGKKKGSAKKRKSNVWDDYTAPAKRSAGDRDTNHDGNGAKRTKREPKPSMMGQWKKQKQQFATKQQTFATTIAMTKHEQRLQYKQLQQQHADRLYDGVVDVDARLTKKQKLQRLREQQQQQLTSAAPSDDASNDSDSTDDGASDGNSRSKRRPSVFATFVETFQRATATRRHDTDDDEDDDDDEESQYDDDDDQYERVLVNEHGEAIDDDGNVLDQSDDDAAIDDVVESVDDDDDDDDDADADADDTTTQDEDPYRRRFVLADFTERDAADFDATPKKFEPFEDAAGSGASVAITLRQGTFATQAIRTSNKPVVRARLLAAWQAKHLDIESLWPTPSLEATLFAHFASYRDVLFAAQTFETTETLRRLSAMHVLNHVLKVRDTVTRNNERLRKRSETHTDTDTMDDKEYRDQGYCRATVLVLLPLRSAALAFVKLLLELLPSSIDAFPNKDRFMREFGSASENSENSDSDADSDTNSKSNLHEWQNVFAAGNNDDCFQLGLALSRKAMRFYCEYHHADIIIASPLAMRQLVGDDVVGLDDPVDRPTVRLSTDALTSIEVCVVDSASLMLMQNIEHLRHVVRALNVAPKEAPEADFARVRETYLAGLGAYLRQTIVFCHGVEPALLHLVTKCCRNASGLIKYQRVYDAADGSASITQVVPQVKQIFQRIDIGIGTKSTNSINNGTNRIHSLTLTAADEVELRFAYFTKHVFAPLLDAPKTHVVIFVPSYFDYVRIRNLFNDPMNKKLIRSVQCCEYTTSKQVSRARTAFFHGKAHVLLVTERFHFYHQYVLRGMRQLIWYAPPVMSAFYPELLNMLGDTSVSGTNGDTDANDLESKSSVALFTRLDLLRMQRIVGNKRAERMCQPKSVKPTFLFC